METILKSNKTLLDEIIDGLSAERKSLPSKLFYDEYGSWLFDRICELEEYYLTRTELQIMTSNIAEIVETFPPNSLLIEFGSGSSTKTRLLLDRIKHLSGYVPIDISEEHLLNSAGSLREEYPGLDIYPLAADYTKYLELPKISKKVEHRITYFPGSTIGNFTNTQANNFLKVIANECGIGGGLLIGFDLIKDRNVLLAAYNDKEGITAKFNMNMLQRLNKEFDADFDLTAFKHSAVFNEEQSRIEMHLVSIKNQVAHIGERKFIFKEEETILTEYSHKYSIDAFKKLTADYFTFEKYWTDENNYFCIANLKVR